MAVRSHNDRIHVVTLSGHTCNELYLGTQTELSFVPRLMCPDLELVIQVASARFSYCGRGFAHFTSYGNPVCTIEVVKLNTYVHGVELKVTVVMGVDS